jgi:dTDP-4-amino-4,6-dideoxygalactose transaminase
MAAHPQVATRLAIDGGTPVRTHAFPSWPHFSEHEIEVVAAILRSGKVNYWTGEQGRQFEREFAAFTDCRHAVAVANGTVALELALQALGIGPGDEVVIPGRTFVATASCAVSRGATPVFADVDRNSQNITAATITPVLSPRTRAIIVVHLAGWPCDLDPILALAAEHGLKVIEDCAQAHGATYKGRPVGSIGHAAAFSFCQDKIITTGGEGGMLTTNDPHIWSRAWSYKDHGKSYDAVYNHTAITGFRWLHESFGTNWRLTEMQSALGRIQLQGLPSSLERRRRLASILTESFGQLPALRVTPPPAEVGHPYYKYYVFVRPERLREGWTRDRVLQAVNAEGIPCQVGSCSEIYREKTFSEDLRAARPHPVARELGDTSLMFLVHPTLSEEDMYDTCSAVKKVMQAASIS